jgi:ABC-type transporter MlaC component
MRTLSIVLVVWLLIVAPARAASPLEYTRTILEQARAIVASSQTHDEKLAALSALFSKFLDSDAMGRQALGTHWSSFTPEQQKEFLGLSANFSSGPTCKNFCSSRIQISFM